MEEPLFEGGGTLGGCWEGEVVGRKGEVEGVRMGMRRNFEEAIGHFCVGFVGVC